MVQYCFPEACKRGLCLSILCQRIDHPELADNIGYVWYGIQLRQAMTLLFGGQGTHSLATMRYNTFIKTVVSASSFVTTERLLSTG